MAVFDKYLALNEPSVIKHLGDAAPWWLWSRTGERVFMANCAATLEMSAIGKAITAERLYSPRHPFAALINIEIKKFTKAPHHFTLNLKNGTSQECIMQEVFFENGLKALFISAKTPNLSFQTLADFSLCFPDPVMIFKSNGTPRFVNKAGDNLKDLGLTDLLGREGVKALKQLKESGKARFSLVTGSLSLSDLPSLDAIFGFVSPQKLADAPHPPPEEAVTTPALPALRLVVTNNNQEAETPNTKPLEIESVDFQSENDEFIIEGTMPAPTNFSPSKRKSLRFTWSCDADQRMTNVSDELAEIVGASHADIVGKTWSELLRNDIRDREENFLVALVNRETKSGHSLQWQVEGGDEIAHIDIAALPVFDRLRGFMGYRGFGLLRSYEKVAKTSAIQTPHLSKEETKNFETVGKVLKAANPKAKAVKTKNQFAEVIYYGNKILQVNEQFLTLTGFETLHDFDQAGGTSRLFAGAHLDNLKNEVLKLTHKKGHDLPVSIRLSRTEFEGKSALRMEIEQVTIVPLQEAVKTPETRHFIHHLAFPTLIINEKGRIEAINEAFATLLGSNETTFLDRSFQSLIAPESHVLAEDYITSLLQNGVRSVINEGREIGYKQLSGRIKKLFTRLSLVNNDVTGHIIVQGCELPTSEPLPVIENNFDLISEVSHEIRTPLNAIIGFSEAIKEERFGAISPSQYRGYIDDIHQAGTHILSLANDLLDQKKAQNQKSDLTLEAHDVNMIIEQSISMMEDQALRAKVIIRRALTRPLPQVLCDKRAFSQILLNILGNSLKFTPVGGQIIISNIINEAGNLVVRLRDTGAGMSEEDLAKAVKPYNKISLDKGGAGLGLSITKRLCEEMGCLFTLNSKRGEGTLAEITFPQMRIIA